MASMDKLKQTMVIALVGVLLVAAGGWYFLVSPQRSSVATLNAEAASVDASNSSLRGQIAQLKAQAADLPGEQAALAAVAKRLPPDLQEANLLDDLTHAADAANVDLQAITPSAPVLATVAAAVVAPAPVASAAGNSGTPVRKAPVAAANQLYQIPVTLTVSGNYFDVEMYIHSLEGMQRAMLITQLSFAKGAPGTSALTGGATASGGPTGGAAVTTKPGSAPTSGTAAGKGKGAKSTAKPVPGTPAGAQAEINRLVPVVPDSNTLSVTISGQVFSMYSPAAAAAAAAVSAAGATATPAPTK
ncbi:MAG: hypothetical protein QOF39_1284 [Frankiales bacterium]|nr:hypothetical protein [Frankiales bacterium]